MMGLGVAAIAVLCVGPVDLSCAPADHPGFATQTAQTAAMSADCMPGQLTGVTCAQATVDHVPPIIDSAAAQTLVLAGVPLPSGPMLHLDTVGDIPAITLVAEADPLQGAASLILPDAATHVLQQIAATPHATGLEAMAFTPTGLWEALIVGTQDATLGNGARSAALWVGGAIWLGIAAAFVAYLLTQRSGQKRGKRRPGSYTRLRERTHDWPPTEEWARRVHHTIQPAPAQEEAPRARRSGSGRRRSSSRPLHRRFSYSSID